MVVRSDGDKVQIAVLDKKDTTSNIYSLEVGDLPHGDHNFEFYFKVENLKMIPGDYDVIISEKNISQLNNTKDNIVYWIALETDSYYNE
jgi:hypothetical protein